MKYLIVKFLRDVKNMWVQFVAVFMMSVLAITIYSGMEGVWYGLQTEVEDYYSETNLADVWVNGTFVTDDMIKDIESLECVSAVQNAMTVTVNLETDSQEKPDVKLISTDSTELLNPKITDGEAIDFDSEDGIWLDETFFEKRGLSVGDKIKLKYNGAEKEFTIAGTILDSEFIYYTGSVTDTVPNHELHGYAVVGNSAAESFYGSYFTNEIRLDVDDSCNMNDLQKEIEDILGKNYYNFSVRDDMSSVSQISKEVKQMQNMANLFSAVFIILAVLSMYSTMMRLVNNQTIQIGTMKAIGFSNFMIRLHYIGYGFFISLAGCFSGILFGLKLVSKAVMKVKKTTLTMPVWNVALSFRVYLIILGIVMACVVATFVATRRGIRSMPAESMRNISNISNKKAFNSTKNSIWNKLAYQTKWAIRDNLQNKVRWLMSVIGVLGSMVLMMAGLGFMDSINYSNDYVYNRQFTYEYKMVLNSDYQPEELEDIEEKITGNYQKTYEYYVDMYYPEKDEKERRTISIIDEGDFINLENKSGEVIGLRDDAVVISNKTAEVLGISAGDVIKFRIIGQDDILEAEVSDIAISPSPQGIFMSKSCWEEYFGKTFVPAVLLIDNTDDYNMLCAEEIVKEGVAIGDQLQSMKIMTKSVMTIIYLMIVASVLLGCIMIYNLGMLNYIERYRDYATMKVLGFYQKEIRGIIIKDCMVTTLIGWLVGIPTGYKFLHYYIGIVQFKTFEWVPTLSIRGFIIASCVVILCSIAVNLAVSHKVTKIPMVEALKSVE